MIATPQLIIHLIHILAILEHSHDRYYTQHGSNRVRDHIILDESFQVFEYGHDKLAAVLRWHCIVFDELLIEMVIYLVSITSGAFTLIALFHIACGSREVILVDLD